MTRMNSSPLSFKTSLGTFRIVAFAEGCSYLLFAITMPLKYGLHITWPNYFIGMAHGILFIAYFILLAVVAVKYKWSMVKIAVSALVSLIPLGTFWAEKKWYLHKK